MYRTHEIFLYSRLLKAHFWHLSKLVNLKPLTVVIYKS